jgi:transcription elongation factor Elf1
MRKIHGFECPHCKKSFSTLTQLKQHRMIKHKEFKSKKLEDEVGMIDKNGNAAKLNGIKVENHKSQNVVISTPKTVVKKILAKSRLNKRSRSKKGKFDCKECGLKYTLARSLNRHLNTAHKGKTLIIINFKNFTVIFLKFS